MASALFAWLVPSAVPLLLGLTLLPKALALGTPLTKRRLYAGFLLGVVAGILGAALESYLGRFTGIDTRAQSLGDWPTLAALILLFAPAEEALKIAAHHFLYRSSLAKNARVAVLLAGFVALGYATADTAYYLEGQRLDAISLTRALLALPTHVFAAAIWAYALGRMHERSEWDTRIFLVAWLSASTLHGLYDHLLFGRSTATLLAVIPLLAAMAIGAYLMGRPLFIGNAIASLRGRPLPPPPSIRAVRAALRRAERPATLRWIAFGSLVTSGVMIVSVAGAVLLAHRLGIDFAAVDAGKLTSTAPLLLLGGAVLAAFPFAGYLVARAHGTGSILEPAMGAGLAIAGTLVLLGLIAPVAVVFGLAFAPVAFVLACFGAWLGGYGSAD